MTAKSQTIEDVIKESKRKGDYIQIDAKLGGRHKEYFEKATTKIDPNIYKGEFKPYNSEDDGQRESNSDALKRMQNQSDTLEAVISLGAGYDFQRDTVEGKGKDFTAYSGTFEDVAKKYLMGEGRELYAHLKSKGRNFYDITGAGTADLEGAVAALAVNGNEATLLGAKDFDKKVSQLASQYGISKNRAVSYVMAHEFVHASQKGQGYDDPIRAELDVEHTLKEYFTAKGDHDLAAVASDRAANVTRNYGHTYERMPSKNNAVASYFGKGASNYNSKANYGKAAVASSN